MEVTALLRAGFGLCLWALSVGAGAPPLCLFFLGTYGGGGPRGCL